jgi:hypothetical protein
MFWRPCQCDIEERLDPSKSLSNSCTSITLWMKELWPFQWSIVKLLMNWCWTLLSLHSKIGLIHGVSTPHLLSLLSFKPNATLFCRSGTIWLQRGCYRNRLHFCCDKCNFCHAIYFMALSMKIVSMCYHNHLQQSCHYFHNLSCVAIFRWYCNSIANGCDSTSILQRIHFVVCNSRLHCNRLYIYQKKLNSCKI